MYSSNITLQETDIGLNGNTVHNHNMNQWDYILANLVGFNTITTKIVFHEICCILHTLARLCTFMTVFYVSSRRQKYHRIVFDVIRIGCAREGNIYPTLNSTHSKENTFYFWSGYLLFHYWQWWHHVRMHEIYLWYMCHSSYFWQWNWHI